MPKISIIAPAYQAEKYVQRFIDTVLNFDYRNLELILVNDASEDKTHEIIEQNKSRIEEAGIEFKYVNLKKNKGQANALNVGLKLVTGEYLAWLDIDDLFLPNCLSKSLETLKSNPDCKMVFSKSLSVKEVGSDEDVDNKNIITFMGKNYKSIGVIPEREFVHDNLFEDYIKRDNVIWQPMRFVETKALFEVLKNKEIYVSRRGQNAQIFLPMSYKYKWTYLDEILSYYVIYSNSHSHSHNSYFLRFEFEKLMIKTINRIKMPFLEKIKYFLLVKYRFLQDDWAEIKKIYVLFLCSRL